MGQYLYILRPTRSAMLTEGPTPGEQAIIAEHFDYLTRLTAERKVILFGRTQTTTPDTLGLCIFEAPDDVAATAIMNNDPAVREGVMTATLYPYKIAGQRA